MWEGDLNPLVIGLNVVHESVAMFCNICLQQGRAGGRSEICKCMGPQASGNNFGQGSSRVSENFAFNFYRRLWVVKGMSFLGKG